MGEFPRGLVVRGGSMLPTLRDGDSLVVTRTAFSALRWGDLLTYAEPGAAAGVEVTHRIIWMDRRRGRIWLRGDAGGHIDRLDAAATGKFWRVSGVSRGGARMAAPDFWHGAWRGVRSLAGVALMKWRGIWRGLGTAARSKS